MEVIILDLLQAVVSYGEQKNDVEVTTLKLTKVINERRFYIYLTLTHKEKVLLGQGVIWIKIENI